MVYKRESLIEYCIAALTSVGVPRPDAAAVAEALTEADARGVCSHGCVRMEGYVECVLSGGIAAESRRAVLQEGPGYALIDAGRGLGIPVSVEAAELVIQKARESGIAVVNVRNSHHHGACGHYTMRCARAGMIGLAMSTGDTIMAATGSAERSIGNNPFSYALPAGRYGILCYDIAMSTVAAGKISMAADEGRSIPLGWLLDRHGNPTEDPKDYAPGGPLVPFGGYKGYGLAIMVESLAGILSGAALLGDIHAWNKDPAASGNVGHCFIAIDPALVDPGFDVARRAEEMIDRLKSSRKAPGVDTIYFPGEIEQDHYAASEARGIFLPPATEHALARVAQMTGLPFDAKTSS